MQYSNIITHGGAHVGQGQDDGEGAKTDEELALRHERLLQLHLLLEQGVDLVVGEDAAVGGVHLAQLLLVLVEVALVVSAVVVWNDREIVS